MTTDADRIAAEGVPVVLKDGRQVRLIYDMRAFRQVEETVGPLESVEDLVTLKPFTYVPLVMAAGLIREELNDVEQIIDLIPTGKLEDYSEAIAEAFNQAFPTAQETKKKTTGTKKKKTSGSPGPTSTGQPQSDSAEATVSSGA